MDWAQAMTMIGINIALMAIVCGFILWAFSKLDGYIKSLANKLDADTKAQAARTDQISARLDQLYQMFIDLLKDQKRPKTDP